MIPLRQILVQYKATCWPPSRETEALHNHMHILINMSETHYIGHKHNEKFGQNCLLIW